MKRRRTLTLLAVISAVTLGGCAFGQSPETLNEAQSSSSQMQTLSSSPESTVQSEVESTSETYNDAMDSDEPVAAQWIMGNSQKLDGVGDASLLAHDFRVGDHDGYYRVVVEFVGAGDPGWTIEWVDQATEIARGKPLPVPSGHVLDVMIHGASWPVVRGSADYYYNGRADKRIDENTLAWFDGSFEADTHIVVSTDREREYRVFVLDNPKRLVIDLRK